MPQDILLTDTGDIAIVNGDFVISESSAQHQRLLLLANKCDYKENPMRGVGTKRYLETSDSNAFAREIRQEFTLDGMEVTSITINAETITVDATYI